MHLKILVGATIAFVGLSLSIAAAGLTTSINAVHDFFDGVVATTTTELAVEDVALPETTDIPAPVIEEAPEVESLPPADPEKKGLELPEFVIPKIPVPIKIPVLTPPVPTPEPAPPVIPTPVIPTPVIPAKPAPVVVPEPIEEPEEPDTSSKYGFVQGAAVNIYCSPKKGALKKSISGSGVIIDSRGIILTVAHVGHYLLLENYPEPGSAECLIRIGSPAKTAYQADLIYVSPEWVEKNGGALALSQAKGNGENDFALIAITGSATAAKLPPSFPYISLSSVSPSDGDDVTIGSYGAEFLSGNQIKTSLYPTIVKGSINDVFTYGTNAVDVISVRGSDAAQSGSSGGGIINEDGDFVGLITTSSLIGGTAQRTLYAITPSHIRKSFQEDMGKNLDSYLKGDLTTLVNNFKDETEDLAESVWEAIF